MADFSLNNLKDKIASKIPVRDEEDGIAADNELETTHDILALFNIAPTIDIPEDVLTPSKLREVRFTRTKPYGFSIRQVDAFHAEVSKTIGFLVKALEQRNRDITKIAHEADKFRVDLMNKNLELSVIEGVGGVIEKDAHGNYLTEDQLSDEKAHLIRLESEIAELRESEALFAEKLQSIKSERDSLRLQIAEFQQLSTTVAQTGVDESVIADYENQIASLRAELEASRQNAIAVAQESGDTQTSELLAELESYRNTIAEYEKWGEDVNKEYSAMETRLAESELLVAQLREAAEAGAEDEEAIQALREEVEATRNQLNEAIANAQAWEEHGNALALEKQATENEKEILQRQIESLEAELAGPVADPEEIENLHAEIAVLKNSLAEYQQSNSEYDTAYTALTEQYNAIVQSLEEHREYAESVAGLQEAHEKLYQDNRLLAQENEELKARLAAAETGSPYVGKSRVVVHNGQEYNVPEGMDLSDLGIGDDQPF